MRLQDLDSWNYSQKSFRIADRTKRRSVRTDQYCRLRQMQGATPKSNNTEALINISKENKNER